MANQNGRIAEQAKGKGKRSRCFSQTVEYIEGNLYQVSWFHKTVTKLWHKGNPNVCHIKIGTVHNVYKIDV